MNIFYSSVLTFVVGDQKNRLSVADKGCLSLTWSETPKKGLEVIKLFHAQLN